ncbi:MAG TPA: GIY-YIG nuclease family protein [Bacteroidetes bacterium]|nr:GIY-YIG nuclease family protein [Bacteroidota bacterium]
MKFKTYIFLSKELDKYYTGSTSVSIEERLRRHNTNHKGYTGKVNDWELIYKKEFTDIKLSRKLEIKIKKRGARRYLESLKTK